VNDLLTDNKASGMAGIPLKSGDKVIGIINIFFAEAHNFTVQEHQLLSLIGNQLGSAIENAVLYSELKSQLDRLAILYELSQQLTATLDVDQVLDAVFSQLQRIVKFNEFFIHFVDDSRMTQTTLLHIKLVNGEQIYLPKLLQPLIIEEGSPVWKLVIEKQTFVDKLSETEIIYTYIPMAVKNNVIGLIVLGTEKETYSETEIRLLESICGLTAIALEKTKLYEEIVQKSQEIQRRNKELDDFTYVVSHDLKEPLISIEAYSKILMDEYYIKLQGDGSEFLQSIVQASTRMKSLIDDLLTLSRISRITESFKPVDVESIIEDIKIDFNYSMQSKNVKLVVQDSIPKVFGNETQMKVLFRNLISNAIKFNNKQNPIIEVGYENFGNDRYKYFIKDNGIGIDEKYFEKIFAIFQRLHSRDEYEGTGAGLAIVKKIVEMHRGNIWVESNLGDGTAFYFTLLKVIEEI
jgi:signal transduction histidine kinase